MNKNKNNNKVTLSLIVVPALLEQGMSDIKLRNKFLDGLVAIGMGALQRREALLKFDNEVKRCRAGQVCKKELTLARNVLKHYKPNIVSGDIHRCITDASTDTSVKYPHPLTRGEAKVMLQNRNYPESVKQYLQYLLISTTMKTHCL